MTLYWDDNYAGSTLGKTVSDACLVDDGWNDKVSSVVISLASARVQTITDRISNQPGQQEIKFFETQGLAGIPVRIYDITGRQVMQLRPGSNRIDIAALKPGVYVLVYSKEGRQIVQKFVR